MNRHRIEIEFDADAQNAEWLYDVVVEDTRQSCFYTDINVIETSMTLVTPRST